jgi:cellulose biosynthesis protein BcsQ
MCPLLKKSDLFAINTFYSFKGGAGRSLTTINTLAASVKMKNITPENPILLIDMDVDSAGISYLCGAQDRINRTSLTSKSILTNEIDFSGRNQLKEVPRLFRETRSAIPDSLISELKNHGYTKQITDWLSNKEWYDELQIFLQNNYKDDNLRMALNSSKSITEFMYKIETRSDWNCLMDISFIVGAKEPESVLFLGADILCGIAFTYDTTVYQDALMRFLGQCRNRNFHSVFIDSASGRQTIAQVAHNVSDKLIVCLRMTTQFQEGTFNYLEFSCKKESDRDIIILPVAVPQNDLKRIKNAKLEMQIKWDYLLKSEININKKRLIKDMLDNGGIPEVEAFKWKEQVLLIKSNDELCEDEKKAIRAFDSLCSILEEHTRR